MTCRFQAHSFRFLVQVLGPFIFNIISPGGGECMGHSISRLLAWDKSRHSEYRLGSSTVSNEKWLYPERVYKEEIARGEILGLPKKLIILSWNIMTIASGQWRSFNRVASPTQVAEASSEKYLFFCHTLGI